MAEARLSACAEMEWNLRRASHLGVKQGDGGVGSARSSPFTAQQGGWEGGPCGLSAT